VAGHTRAAVLLAPNAVYGYSLVAAPTRPVVIADHSVRHPFASVVGAWDTRTWEERVVYQTPENVSFTGLAIDATGTRLATRFGVFDVDTGARVLGASILGYKLEWSVPGPLVAGFGYDNSVTVTSAATGAPVTQLTLTRKYHVQDCAFSPDGRFLAVVSNEASVRVWTTDDWKEQKEFAWGIGPLKCVAFAPDGLRAACGSASGRILIWDWDL
jgi:WD40 repeat protein